MKKKIVVCCIVICLILNQVGILKNIYASTKNEFSKKSYVLLTEDKSKIKDILKEFDVTEKIENDSTYEVCLNISEQEAELLSDNNEILISENEKVYASERHNEKNRRTIKNKKKRKRELQKEWNLRMINAEEENSKEPEKKVKVAIIDSGVDECEDIDVVKRINLIPGEENVTSLFEDTSGHGTSIAGIIAAKDNGKLEKFSDEVDYVNGSWYDSVHESIAVKATKNIELTAAQIKIVKKGAKFPDIQFAGLSENPQWHGGGNYISNYRCITLMALAEGDGKKLEDVHRPKGMNKEHYKKMKKQAQSINWTGYDKNNQKVLLGYKNTKKNRELFLWGMAMHAATDVYAHRAYAKISGKWTHLDHYNNNKYADRTDKFETRFLAAKQTARDIMLCYEVGDSGDHWEFVHTKKYYDGTYKLKNLVSYAKQQETLDESNSGIEELKIGNID